MNRPARIVTVTAGLVAAGGVAGALAADLAFAITLVAVGEYRELLEVQGMLAVGLLGALLGGVLLPSACWLLLRRVPLGLAVLGTLLGTVTGGALGWISRVGPGVDSGAIPGALAGFALAALALRLFASAPREPRVATT